MAPTANNTILDSIEWARRMNFNRRLALGNGLEPALTAANIVMQTILGPPFEWAWNNSVVTFQCNSTTTAATITNTSLTGDVATFTTQSAHNFDAGQFVTTLGTTNGGGVFNVINLEILAVPTATTFTVEIETGNVASAADTGSASVNPQDYAVEVDNFRSIEYASVMNPTQARWLQLQVKNSLALDSTQGRPTFIAPNTQDSSSGIVTFRVMPAPDLDYPVSMQIQNSAPTLTSLNDTWSPLPDYFSYIYNWGFLAMMYMFADDPRFQMASQKFIAHLLGANEGMSEQEKNIFYNNWNNLTGIQQQQTAQGIQARGV